MILPCGSVVMVIGPQMRVFVPSIFSVYSTPAASVIAGSFTSMVCCCWDLWGAIEVLKNSFLPLEREMVMREAAFMCGR